MSIDYLFEDWKGPNLEHPDAAIRLVSVVHRFAVPKMSTVRQISFAKSFDTVGKHPKTRQLMLHADELRSRLSEACKSQPVSAERVTADARRYLPLIQTILISCKVQPEMARLDQKLIFEWCSGLEKHAHSNDKSSNKKNKKQTGNPKFFASEAIMYEVTMALACQGLGHAAAATENSVAGEFAAASRDYAQAAGIFQYLAQEHLPQWVSKGSKVSPNVLPSECHVAATQAFATLFMSHGQQMAVASVLMKPGTPNYGLLAKLCFGIREGLEDFVSALRKSEASACKERMDPDVFVLLAFLIGVQNALSLYFQARSAWEKDQNHGVAIALLSEATVALRTRPTITSVGLPDIAKTPALLPLQKDLLELRKHCTMTLETWEKDNSSVYFAAVPQALSAEHKLQTGVRMNKATKFEMESVDPALFVLPEGALERSDSDLARELQEKLNAGD